MLLDQGDINEAKHLYANALQNLFYVSPDGTSLVSRYDPSLTTNAEELSGHVDDAGPDLLRQLAEKYGASNGLLKRNRCPFRNSANVVAVVPVPVTHAPTMEEPEEQTADHSVEPNKFSEFSELLSEIARDEVRPPESVALIISGKEVDISPQML